jgi:hypothetical protein
MTLDELQAYVWHRLPLWRKRMAGRAEVDALVRLAVDHWDADAIGAVRPSEATAGMVNRMRHARQRTAAPAEVGFLWLFLFELVASAVVQLLIKWWSDSASNRAAMATMHGGRTP